MTMVELVVTSTLTLVIVLAVGTLIEGGQRSWLHTYNLVNNEREDAARAIVAAFGIIGRRSNRSSYVLYQVNNGVFTALVPSSSEPDTIVRADAVEFRSWDAELDQTDSHDVMNTEKAASAYDLFYVEAGQLKVDHGVYPPGAVPSGSGGRNTAGVTTRVLANHVIVDPNVGPFSHTTNAGVGQGCVRLSLTLKDPATDKTTRVLAATLMRNIWPR
jgi:hypothetical protein